MNNINWKDGAVCYARDKQWFSHVLNTLMDSFDYTEITKIVPLNWLVKQSDFQLNEICTGDFIAASELDTEQKYNEVVEVFGLFGFKPHYMHAGFQDYREQPLSIDCGAYCYSTYKNDRKLTYHQIIAISKLKRMMLECEKSKLIENASMMKQLRNSELDTPVKFEINYEVNPFSKYSKENFPKIDLEEKPKRRNKSKQAYDILKSLDYEYDLVKQKWFKKEYI